MQKSKGESRAVEKGLHSWSVHIKKISSRLSRAAPISTELKTKTSLLSELVSQCGTDDKGRLGADWLGGHWGWGRADKPDVGQVQREKQVEKGCMNTEEKQQTENQNLEKTFIQPKYK